MLVDGIRESSEQLARQTSTGNRARDRETAQCEYNRE